MEGEDFSPNSLSAMFVSFMDGSVLSLGQVCLLNNTLLHGNLTFDLELLPPVNSHYLLGDISEAVVVFLDNEQGTNLLFNYNGEF